MSQQVSFTVHICRERNGRHTSTRTVDCKTLSEALARMDDAKGDTSVYYAVAWEIPSPSHHAIKRASYCR